MKYIIYFIASFILTVLIMWGFESITSIYLFQNSSIAVIILFVAIFIGIKAIFKDN